MKKKLPSLFCLFFFLSLPTITAEEAAPVEVEPNVYEKKEVNIDRNYETKEKKVQELPQPQQSLTFEPSLETESEILQDKLTLVSNNETNTIVAKAEQLTLFDNLQVQKGEPVEELHTSQATSILMIAMILIVAIVLIIIMFTIAPRITSTNKS